MPEVFPASLKFAHDTQRFECLGLDLNRPVDSVKPGKYPVLTNVRAFVAGRIEPRDGLTQISTPVVGQTPVHSCRRLNDPLNSSFARVVGAGTHLAVDGIDLDSGYSGDPLALVPSKPRSSPSSWMYVADRLRMRKVTVAGLLHPIGFAAPSAAPSVALSASPKYKVVDDLIATAGWAQGGTAGAPALLGYRTNTTITYILYDSGTTGWASVVPAAMTGIGPGCRMNFNPGGGTDETVVVQQVFPGSSATTVARVLYDSGTTGACSLVFTIPLSQNFCDALVRNTTRSENVRVLSVTQGPDGTTSIRASTTNTWVAGDTIQVQNSFRVYLANNHATTEVVRIDGIRTAVTSGTGTLTKTSALDISAISSAISLQPSDYMHISMRVSDPTVITEIKVLLDVDAATNDFAHNFYWKSFRANDITPAASNTQPLVTTGQTIVQRSILGNPNATPAEIAAAMPPPVIDPNTGEDVYQYADYTYTNPVTGVTFQQTVSFVNPQTGQPIYNSQQMTAGVGQWVELRFPIAGLIRIGSDLSRTLANVAALRVTMIVTGNVNVDLSSWWVGGGYGPDVGDPTATPYHYRYRVRCLSTNVASNWSPATRYLASPLRQSVTITPTQYAAPAGSNLLTTDLVLDIERYGGQVTDWHYIGFTANTASPSYTDIFDDDVVAGQPIIGQEDYQPWPILGSPVNGTTTAIAGTTVQDAATNFNTSWAPGTRIFLNNLPYTIARVISTALLELNENAGSQGVVSWNIPEPTILAQPLPCLWEWDGAFFACGDTINAGRLYYSNPDSETTTPTNYIDLTSPSEPLMNGVQYNTRAYVFSSESFIQLLKTGDPNEPFRHEHIPNGKGLFARWALTREPTPLLCFLAKDGINATLGGSPMALTDADLYELFPNEGNLGVAINGYNPPNLISAQAANLRLTYYDEYLYFDFVDTAGARATLVLAFDLGAAVRGEAPGGWFYDTYTPGVVFHYGEEGQGVHALLCGGADAASGKLYQYTGNSDNGTAFTCTVGTMSRDQGSPRENKLYGDVMVDLDAQGVAVTITPYIAKRGTSLAATTTSVNGRSLVVVPLGSPWQTATDIALNVSWSQSTSARPLLFIWEPRWTLESAPLAAISWEISPTTFGMEGFKHIGLCKVTHVSTVDLILTFTVDNITQTSITIPNSGGVYKQTIFRVPAYKGKLYKLRIASSGNATPFRLDTRDSFFEVKDWGSDGEYRKLRIFGDYSMVEG